MRPTIMSGVNGMEVIVVLHPGLEMVFVTRPTIMSGVNGMKMK